VRCYCNCVNHPRSFIRGCPGSTASTHVCCHLFRLDMACQRLWFHAWLSHSTSESGHEMMMLVTCLVSASGEAEWGARYRCPCPLSPCVIGLAPHLMCRPTHSIKHGGNKDCATSWPCRWPQIVVNASRRDPVASELVKSHSLDSDHCTRHHCNLCLDDCFNPNDNWI